MKYTFLLLCLLLAACQSKVPPAQTVITKDSIVYMPADTVIVKEDCNHDSLLQIIDKLGAIRSKLEAENKALRYTRDTLSTQLFLSRYKVEKVRFYLNIITKNPSQKQFFPGWVRRAIN